MPTTNEDFFLNKRDWSLIKDDVLRTYMVPYLTKIQRLSDRGRTPNIMLIDCYAGAGTFDDGSDGSPLIMTKAAERHAPGRYDAFFINCDSNHHTKLQAALATNAALLPDKRWSGRIATRLGKSEDELPEIAEHLGNASVFLYLDPFGLKGCAFALIRPFLERSSRYSTEIVMTFNMPGVHRMAARKQVAAGKMTPQITANHQILDEVFGGDYWRQYLLDDNEATAEEREWKLIEAYRLHLTTYLRYVQYCPVRESSEARIKYFIVCASRHIDCLQLMNEAMTKAYFKQMHAQSYKDSLFAESDWRADRDIRDLAQTIVATVGRLPQSPRNTIWQQIVQDHFMRYLASEYKEAVKTLVKQKVLCFSSQTKKLNDDALLWLAE